MSEDAIKMITRKAYAKINLCLDVLRRRPDGYHDVKMVMQTVNLYDTLTLSKIDEGIVITTNTGELPLNVHLISSSPTYVSVSMLNDCDAVFTVSITALETLAHTMSCPDFAYPAWPFTAKPLSLPLVVKNCATIIMP